MDRRDFLTLKRKRTEQSVVSSGRRTYTGIAPYNGPWTRNEVQHLLKRTLFGSRRADLDYFATRTLDQAVDELLAPVAPLPTPPVNDYEMDMPDPNVPAGSTWINDLTADEDLNAARRLSFKKWWTGVMLRQDRSIREKLTLFWADHFGTETNTIRIANFVYRHNDLLRRNALGNFRSLIKGVTIDAGMLIYLNGYLNAASAPDENYARELMELYTLGKGPTVAYTEPDVRTAARILTGWRIDLTTGQVFFEPAQHDTNNKQFSAYYNNTLINGQTGAAGAAETDALINMLLAKEETARYIVRCLYRWFVYYKIDDGEEQDVIEPLAAILRNNNYDIHPVLETLFKSEHFFDVLNQGCLIKPPVDHVIGTMREFGVSFPDASSAYEDAYGMWGYLSNWTAAMGQNVGDPPDVSGWPAFYQEPAFHEMWINHDTLPKRNQFTDIMVWNGYTRNDFTIQIDVIAFTRTLPAPADPNALINDTLSVLYRVPLSETARQQIKQSILLSGQTQDYYWTNAWNGYIADPTNMAAAAIIANRLKSLYQYLMNLPEYQLS
jgi:uncharacterized protein (DUF1800 family)